MATIEYKYCKASDTAPSSPLEDTIINYINSDCDEMNPTAYDLRNECFFELSPLRENILNWYPFKSDASVLEIGGGLGAITGVLCRKCASVTSVELSKKRADAICARYSKYDNLKVIAGDFNDIEFSEKFDYIVLIGILEYAPIFNFSDDPFSEFLGKVGKLLKPSGKLLIGIENRFGLKYWCGAEEDHTKNMFDGLDGYEGIDSVKTFSKDELSKLLSSNGFAAQDFYYPYPDYKFPNIIYTDSSLPSPNSMTTAREFYLDPSHFTANERRILPQVAANGVFPFFSNSFFVEASTEKIEETKVTYAVLSTDRKAKYAVGTAICNNGKVVKFPLSEKAITHVSALDESQNYLLARGIKMVPQVVEGSVCITNFINQPTADKVASALLANGKRAEVKAIFAKLKEAILSSSPSANNENGAIVLEKAYIDLNLSNSFLIDGELTFFDQEWLMENTDARFVLFRAIWHFASLSGDFALAEELFAENGINSELRKTFRKMDEAFLKEVNDDAIVSFLNSHTYGYDGKLLSSVYTLKHHNFLLNARVAELDSQLAIAQSSLKSALGQKIKNYSRRLVPFRVRAKFKRLSASPKAENYYYEKWIKNHPGTPVPEDKSIKFSVLVPLYNTDKKLLAEMIDSVVNQTYPNWELCLADASDTAHGYVEKICRKYTAKDSRIKYERLKENLGISGNTNECRKMATGEYITLLDHDDLVLPHALASVANVIYDSAPDIIYSDEDKTDEHNHRHLPFFKPDFNRDLLYSQMYICHLLVFRSELFDKVGGLSDKHSGAQDYDLMLRFTEHTDKIHHISDILYSWRETSTSTSVNPGSKPYAHDAGKSALDAHLKRRYGDYAHAEDSEYLFVYDARFDLLKDEPLISIIIPTKDGADYVSRCVSSILETSTYKNYEILILDNNSERPETYECFKELKKCDSRIRIIRAEFAFNWSKLNNFGIKHARGEVFIFLNNDTYIISPDWIERLAENALRPDVGAVGALLLYEDGTIQHAGVVVGMNHWADHVFKAMPPEHYGHGFVSPVINRDVLAVTGACLASSRAAAARIGGFNETFLVCGSDVEYCVKAHKAGLSVLYNANVKLCHYESKSRDVSAIPKIDFLLSDIVYNEFRNGKDPFYNKNLDGFSTTPRVKAN